MTVCAVTMYVSECACACVCEEQVANVLEVWIWTKVKPSARAYGQ